MEAACRTSTAAGGAARSRKGVKTVGCRELGEGATAARRRAHPPAFPGRCDSQPRRGKDCAGSLMEEVAKAEV